MDQPRPPHLPACDLRRDLAVGGWQQVARRAAIDPAFIRFPSRAAGEGGVLCRSYEHIRGPQKIVNGRGRRL